MKVLKQYVQFSLKSSAENFPILPPKTAYNIINHLLYCNGNGTLWLDSESDVDYLAMQIAQDLESLEPKGYIAFPFIDVLELVDGDKCDEYIQSYKAKWGPMLNTIMTDEVDQMDFESDEFWEAQVWESFKRELADLRKYKHSWAHHQRRPELASFAFPYDFQREVKPASERYIPALNLLNITKERNILHNHQILTLTARINEAVIKVFNQIIDSEEYQEILGEKIIAYLRNRLNHFTSFHAKHFFHLTMN